eukprot:351801-Chlamydomonas_euryale.AAC.8
MAAVVEWAMDPTTAPRTATSQPEAASCPGGRGCSLVSRRGRAPNRHRGAATPRVRHSGDARRASPGSDGYGELGTAHLELDGATTEGSAEKALPSDSTESEGQEPGSEDDDAAPTDDGGTDDDAADVQQLKGKCAALHCAASSKGSACSAGRL